MEAIDVLVNSSATVVVVAIFLATMVERVSEYILVPILDQLFRMADRKMSKEMRLVLISLINFCIYLLLLRYDFMTPLMSNLKVSLNETSGLILSALLVAGGSNFVHLIFKHYEKPKRNDWANMPVVTGKATLVGDPNASDATDSQPKLF